MFNTKRIKELEERVETLEHSVDYLWVSTLTSQLQVSTPKKKRGRPVGSKNKKLTK